MLRLPQISLRSTLLLILTLFLVWVAFWGVAAVQYQQILQNRINEGRDSGYDITYDRQKLFGFPFRVGIRFENLHWVNADHIAFQVGTIDILAAPWHWYDYTVHFKGGVRLEAPIANTGEALILGGASGRGKIKITSDGSWLTSQLELDMAEFGKSANYLSAAKHIMVHVERPEVEPTDHKQTGLTLMAEADDLVLPTAMPAPFGDRLEHFAVKARVMGWVPDFRNPLSVRKWNEASNVLEVDEVAFDWGNLNLTARGTLGFDDDLQPEGAFASSMQKPEAVFQTLLEKGYIPARQAGMMQSALSLFAKPAMGGHQGGGVDLPISIQLGTLFFGPVRIFAFPQIEWPVMTE